MLNILIATDSNLGPGGEASGVNTTIRNQIEVAPQLGDYKLGVIHSGLFPAFPQKFYPSVRFARAWPHLFEQALDQVLDGKKPDVTDLRVEGTVGWSGFYWCEQNKRRRISWNTTMWERYIRLPESLIQFGMTQFHQRSEKVLIATELGRKRLIGYGLNPEKVQVLRRGVRESFAPAIEKDPHYCKRPFMLYMGRVDQHQKNVSAALRVQHEGTIGVMGIGPDLEDLKREFSAEIASGRIIFFGELRGHEQVQVLQQADLLLMSSETEIFGQVMIEALRCKVPIAAVEGEGQREIIVSPKLGWISNDLDYSVSQVLRLADPDECHEYVCQNYDLRTVTKQWLELLESTI